MKFTFTWTNWTFGFWWDRRKLGKAGIDLGPCEWVWHIKKGPRYTKRQLRKRREQYLQQTSGAGWLD